MVLFYKYTLRRVRIQGTVFHLRWKQVRISRELYIPENEIIFLLFFGYISFGIIHFLKRSFNGSNPQKKKGMHLESQWCQIHHQNYNSTRHGRPDRFILCNYYTVLPTLSLSNVIKVGASKVYIVKSPVFKTFDYFCEDMEIR